jgi:RHS repeat-associated protein
LERVGGVVKCWGGGAGGIFGGNAVTPSGYTQLAYPGQMKTLPDLWYNRHRDFDPTTGRYVQADPIGL